MYRRLEGKRAVVTGAGVGIGLNCALDIAREGAQVVLHYASSANGALEGVNQIITAGGRAAAVQGNLSKVEDCIRIIDEAVEFMGGIDILVNNAGMTARREFLDIDQEFYDSVLNLNMRGYFFCAQQAVRHMIKQGTGGSIINMTSIHAFLSMPEYAAYATTKGAIVAFTRQLAKEMLEHKIRVNALAPGMIEVPRHLDNPHYDHERACQGQLWGRVGTPHDCAKITTFLASDDADFITAQIIAVDGGATAGQGGKPMKIKKD